LNLILTPQEIGPTQGKDFKPVHGKPGETGFLQYTSGSTGNPKGVVLSHANLMANVRAWVRR
jgi:long-subunit acyl-CoA synthetase (AMP-forming)